MKKRAAPAMTDKPCPRCIEAYYMGAITHDMIQRMPAGVWAPRAKVPGGKPCCFDCAAADTVAQYARLPTWGHARTAVGNDREESLRLPGVPMGLIALGLMRASQPGDLKRHIAWLHLLDRSPALWEEARHA